jgi:hypothetical protein
MGQTWTFNSIYLDNRCGYRRQAWQGTNTGQGHATRSRSWPWNRPSYLPPKSTSFSRFSRHFRNYFFLLTYFVAPLNLHILEISKRISMYRSRDNRPWTRAPKRVPKSVFETYLDNPVTYRDETWQLWRLWQGQQSRSRSRSFKVIWPLDGESNFFMSLHLSRKRQIQTRSNSPGF